MPHEKTNQYLIGKYEDIKYATELISHPDNIILLETPLTRNVYLIRNDSGGYLFNYDTESKEFRFFMEWNISTLEGISDKVITNFFLWEPAKSINFSYMLFMDYIFNPNKFILFNHDYLDWYKCKFTTILVNELCDNPKYFFYIVDKENNSIRLMKKSLYVTETETQEYYKEIHEKVTFLMTTEKLDEKLLTN